MQSVTSRACEKFLGKSAERNIKSVWEVSWRSAGRNIKSVLDVPWRSAERNIKSVLDIPWRSAELNIKSVLDGPWMQSVTSWACYATACSTHSAYDVNTPPHPTPPHPIDRARLREKSRRETEKRTKAGGVLSAASQLHTYTQTQTQTQPTLTQADRQTANQIDSQAGRQTYRHTYIIIPPDRKPFP